MKLLRTTVALLAAALIMLSYSSHGRDDREMVKATGTGLSPSLPQNISSNQLNQRDMDTLGWQMFVALNWPALPGVRGAPDRNRTIGDPGPVVWETWKTPNEVFYPDGSQPASWEVYGPIVPPECTQAGAKNGGAAQPVILVNRTNQASGGSLTDQNGNIVHYFISFNRPVFDFIYGNGYYNIAGQDKMAGPVDFSAGAAEMKAAWRILLPTESDAVKQRFFRRNMYVYTPALGNNPATCKYQEMALLGLHFNLKVTYPDNSTQWLMATFEQVDNVPPFGTPYKPGKDDAHTLPYSLFNKSCYTSSCKYNWSTEFGRPVATPTEAIRTMNIDPEAKALNPQMQQSLRQAAADSPWQYYEMITTQYPSDPKQLPVGNPTPATSANTTMETYVRPSSCLGCHHDAQDINAKYFADYSFMLAQACPKPLFGSTEPTAACPKKTQQSNTGSKR